MRKSLVEFGNALVVLAAIPLACPPGVAREQKEATPRLVLLVRHAEKPSGEKTSVGLGAGGERRAGALPGSFAKSTSRPDPLATPDFIFAAKDSKHGRRCTETVLPLAEELGRRVNAEFANDDSAKLATEVLGNPQYAGETILICWHHGNLHGLAKEFGATGAPDRWKSGVFDRVWQITYAPSGKAMVADLPQRLMPGDSRK